jgi:hypothetical protein
VNRLKARVLHPKASMLLSLVRRTMSPVKDASGTYIEILGKITTLTNVMILHMFFQSTRTSFSVSLIVILKHFKSSAFLITTVSNIVTLKASKTSAAGDTTGTTSSTRETILLKPKRKKQRLSLPIARDTAKSRERSWSRASKKID